MKSFTKQKDEFLTYTDIFMYSNWKYFITDMYEEFKNWEVIGVFGNNTNTNGLGLNVIKTFTITYSAYVNSLHLIDEIKKYIDDNQIKNKLFLITGGPFANILIYELFKHEKNNVYLDIGSALDIKLGLGETKPGQYSWNDQRTYNWFE